MKYTTETNENYSLLDNQTGEIKELKITRRVTQEEFIMVFLKTIPELWNLEGNQLKLLMYCWLDSSFNKIEDNEGNIIRNDILFKNKVRQMGLDLTNGAIDVYISQLTKANILIRVCRGAYLLNPNYFFKGKISDNTKMKLNVIAPTSV